MYEHIVKYKYQHKTLKQSDSSEIDAVTEM